MNKNITLSVPERMLKALRQVAVEQETTVNGLVRNYFENLLAGKQKISPAETQRRRRELKILWQRIDATGGAEVGRKIRREELYDRGSLR